MLFSKILFFTIIVLKIFVLKMHGFFFWEWIIIHTTFFGQKKSMHLKKKIIHTFIFFLNAWILSYRNTFIDRPWLGYICVLLAGSALASARESKKKKKKNPQQLARERKIKSRWGIYQRLGGLKSFVTTRSTWSSLHHHCVQGSSKNHTSRKLDKRSSKRSFVSSNLLKWPLLRLYVSVSDLLTHLCVGNLQYFFLFSRRDGLQFRIGDL